MNARASIFRLCRPARSRRARGSVLVIVLITIVFAVTALVAFVEKAGDDLIVESREVTGHRLRQDAYSALEVTLAVLEQFRSVNSGLHSPAEGWSEPLEFADWQPESGRIAEVSFEDESGKLSLPNVDAATLLNLFESWELPQADAERLTDSLLSWMRKDYVPATSRYTDYDQGATPYGPPLRSMRSYSELAAIDFAREVFYDENGRPNERWHRFVDAVSLLDFKQSNINSGRTDVAAAFGVESLTQQRQLREFLEGTGGQARQGPGYFRDVAEAAALMGTGKLPQAYGTTISALRINVTIREGRTTFRVSAVVAPSSGGAKVVDQVAETPKSSVSEAKERGKSPSPASSTASTPTKKLNYPFTLLEIRENDEIPPVPVAETEA